MSAKCWNKKDCIGCYRNSALRGNFEMKQLLLAFVGHSVSTQTQLLCREILQIHDQHGVSKKFL